MRNRTQTTIRSTLYALLFIILLSLPGCQSQNGKTDETPWSVRMAESVMARHPVVYDDWDYVTGTVLRGFEEVWQATGDAKYYNYMKSTIDSVITEDGEILDYDLAKYNIDEIKTGSIVLTLYKETGAEKYKKAADLLHKQLFEQPRNTQGGFWHKQRYPYQMWLDGLYMGAPFYAEYGKLFDQPEIFDDVVNQFVLIEEQTRDPQTGLLYHAWDEKKQQEWADPETGLSRIFWGRAMGWYAMALVDVLDYLPATHDGRQKLIEILQRLAPAIESVQDDSTGVWWQVLDQPGREGNYLEASASCMFVYALAKATRLSYIDQKYQAVAQKGYDGILEQFITENADGTIDLNQICRSAGLGFGRDGSYEYYVYQEKRVSNDGKGVGPFITASVELEKLK